MSAIIKPSDGHPTFKDAVINPMPLTRDKAVELAQAITQFRETLQTTVKTEKGEILERGAAAYLFETLVSHANELLGCWFVVHEEYDPLLRGVAAILRRIMPNSEAVKRSEGGPGEPVA